MGSNPRLESDNVEHHRKVSEPVRDPVCGMTVDPQTDLREVHAGATYAFCSVHCQTKFRENPERYVGEESLEAGAVVGEVERVAEGAAYICPMDPEIRQDGPGSCPKCGMALEPEIPVTPATRTQYTCPMHPEIVKDEPGSCPICGMA
ncbi:MAG: YHS domain-containing protein, partial [Gemmatimonadetes bacterium]|nr:YHS domain-containing protein [Gemmatimonadota bacterium]